MNTSCKKLCLPIYPSLASVSVQNKHNTKTKLVRCCPGVAHHPLPLAYPLLFCCVLNRVKGYRVHTPYRTTKVTRRPDLSGTVPAFRATVPPDRLWGSVFVPLYLNGSETPCNFQFISRAFCQLQPCMTCAQYFAPY